MEKTQLIQIPKNLKTKVHDLLLANSYLFLDEYVGSGGFGVVVKAHEEYTHEIVAVKIIPIISQNESDQRTLFGIIGKEILTIKALLPYRYVLPYRFDIIDSEVVLLGTEYCPGGSLAQFMSNERENRISELQICTYSRQILSGLYGIHKAGFLHRDIKPENILLDSNNNILIADLGLAYELSGKSQLSTLSSAGTDVYLSYEVYNSLAPQSKSSDIWSFGLVILELALGRDFATKSTKHSLSKNKVYKFLDNSGFSEDFRDFISSCFCRQPSERPFCHELLKHKWFDTCQVSSDRIIIPTTHEALHPVQSSSPKNISELSGDPTNSSEATYPVDRAGMVSSDHHSSETSSDTDSYNGSNEFTDSQYGEVGQFISPHSHYSEQRYHSWGRSKGNRMVRTMPNQKYGSNYTKGGLFPVNKTAPARNSDLYVDNDQDVSSLPSTPSNISEQSQRWNDQYSIHKCLGNESLSLPDKFQYLSKLPQIEILLEINFFHKIIMKCIDEHNKKIELKHFYINGPLERQIYLSILLSIFTHLENLVYVESGFNDWFFLFFSKAMKYLTNLSHLDFHSNQIHDDGAEHLFSSLKYITSLQSLDLSYNKIASAGCISLSKNLSHVQHLRKLLLSKNRIGDDGFISLSRNISSISSLTDLQVYGCGITFVSINEFSSNIRYLPNLKTLVLGENSIGDRGFLTVIDSFVYMGNLQLLNLRNCEITGEHMQIFQTNLPNLRNLKRFLIFSGNNIPDKDITNIRSLHNAEFT